MRSHWRRPGYWRWWWQEDVGSHTKRGLIGTLAIGLAIAGYFSADQLSSSQEAVTYTTFTTERVITQVRTIPADAPRLPNSRRAPEVVTMTTTEPGKTDVVTVRRERPVIVREPAETVTGRERPVIVREPAETVTKQVTVRGPVRERVVTDRRVDEVVRTETVDRVRTVRAPGATETVVREITQPVRTVTETRTVPVTVTDQTTVKDVVTVTDRTTVRDLVTVTQPVTVTDKVTVTNDVTVTVTVKR